MTNVSTKSLPYFVHYLSHILRPALSKNPRLVLEALYPTNRSLAGWRCHSCQPWLATNQERSHRKRMTKEAGVSGISHFHQSDLIPTLEKSTSIGLFIKGPPPPTRTKVNTHHSCGPAQKHLAYPCLLPALGPSQKPPKQLASGPPKPRNIRKKVNPPGRLDSIPFSTPTDPRASALTSLKCADPHITDKPHNIFNCTTLIQVTFSLSHNSHSSVSWT